MAFLGSSANVVNRVLVLRRSNLDNDTFIPFENKGRGATPLSNTSKVSFHNFRLNSFVAEWREKSRRGVVNAKDGDMTMLRRGDIDITTRKNAE